MKIKTVLCVRLVAPALAVRKFARLLALVTTLACATLSSLHAEQTGTSPHPVQGASAGSGADQPRRPYDHAAFGTAKAQGQSGVAAALDKINPQNKDYGATVEQARIAAFEETVESFYWWSCIVLTLLLMTAVMYIVWLWRQRDLRLRVAGDVVAQLYNSHVAARARAIEAIEKHNQLVRRYNAQSVETAAMRGATAQKDAVAGAKDGLEAAEKLHAKPSKSASKTAPENQQSPLSSDAPVEADVQEIAPGMLGTNDLTVLQEQLRQLTAQNKAQQKASEQKIAQLRAQLGRAHHSLEEARSGAPAAGQA